MAKYKFIKDKEEPSEESIRSKMDFKKVLEQSQQLKHLKQATQPAYKKPLLLGFLILIGIICLMLILDEHEQTVNETSQKDSTEIKDSIPVKK